MIFGPNHYVPVLKIKRGEKRTLRCLSEGLRRGMTPLLEIVERKADKAATIEKHLDTAFKDLAENASLFKRVFLDAREIAPDGPGAAAQVFERARSARLAFTPVTGISRTVDVDAVIKHGTDGIALRVTREEFERGDLPRAIPEFMARRHLAPEGIDLIVDLGAVEEMILDGVERLARLFLDEIPEIERWRTLTVSASAFPMSMAVVPRNSHCLVERTEWMSWRHRLFANRGKLKRLPTFSDCIIQHPRGVEGFNFRTMQVSASIRYALPEQWLLIKGESTRGILPSIQFPSLAKKLVYGHLQPHYYGPGHCEGCKLMKDAADGAEGLGSAEAWRRLGTIHHISMVMQELASLPWS